MKKLAIVIGGMAAFPLYAVAGPASAQVPTQFATQTTTFLVTANVTVSCTIAANNLVFGDYLPAGGALTAQSQIQVRCTNSAAWNIGLNAGTFTGATVTTRKMKGPGSFSLNYSLFSDAARSNNWGNTLGVDTVSGTGTGGDQIATVYGQIPATQNVGPGGYVDTITATVTF
jgi:spore coat protein U-like protein